MKDRCLNWELARDKAADYGFTMSPTCPLLPSCQVENCETPDPQESIDKQIEEYLEAKKR